MLIGSTLSALLLAAAPPATSTPEADASTRQFSVALDSVFSLHHGNFGTSSTFQFGVRPRPHFEISGTVGVAHQQWFQQRGPEIAMTRVSNVMLGGRWIQDDPGRRHHGYVGLSLVLPTDIGGEDLQFERLLAVDAIRMRGGWDAWLWLPSTSAVLVPFGWRRNGARGFVGLDGALAGLAHLRGALGVGGQLRVYAGGSVGRAVLGGYGSASFETSSVLGAGGAGGFVHASLCKAGREECPVQVTATVGVGTIHTPIHGVRSPSLTTGLGLRWGTPTGADGR